MRPLLKPLMVVVAGLISSLLLASPVRPGPESGPVTDVEFRAMLTGVEPGGVIELGKRRVTLTHLPPLAPSANVTIRGGVFGPVVIQGWRNVTLDGATFEGPPGTSDYTYLLVANKPENLTIRNSRFTGYRTPDGKLHVRGPSIREGRNVTIERSRFEGLAGFTNFIRTDGAIFRDNDLKTIREGLNLQGGRNIVIERNRFEDFQPFGEDHADGVQFFTMGLNRPDDTATRDVTIRHNLIIAAGAQGIFSGDQIGMAATGRGFQRFVIEENIVIGAGWHGITAAGIEDVRIRNNRVFRVADVDTMDSRISVIAGASGIVEGNEADFYILQGEVEDKRNKTERGRSRKVIDAVIAEWMARFRNG